MSPTDEQLQRAGLLGEDGRPTARYARYRERQREYEAALTARDEAYAAALRDPAALQQWPFTGRRYQDAVEDALERWYALGHKSEVEAALAGTRPGGGSRPCGSH